MNIIIIIIIIIIISLAFSLSLWIGSSAPVLAGACLPARLPAHTVMVFGHQSLTTHLPASFIDLSSLHYWFPSLIHCKLHLLSLVIHFVTLYLCSCRDQTRRSSHNACWYAYAYDTHTNSGVPTICWA